VSSDKSKKFSSGYYRIFFSYPKDFFTACHPVKHSRQLAAAPIILQKVCNSVEKNLLYTYKHIMLVYFYHGYQSMFYQRAMHLSKFSPTTPLPGIPGGIVEDLI